MRRALAWGALRIHKKDGTFEEEQTYPRGADPQKDNTCSLDGTRISSQSTAEVLLGIREWPSCGTGNSSSAHIRCEPDFDAHLLLVITAYPTR